MPPEATTTSAGRVAIELPKPRQWELLSLVPIGAGLYWLLAGTGGHWLIWSLLPGGLLFATGTAMLLMPGETRVTALMALGALLGALLFPVVWLIADFGTAFLTTLGSAASFLTAGRLGLSREPLYEGAPPPELNTVLDAKSGLDEAVVGYFLASASIPSGDSAALVCAETLELEKALNDRGYAQEPARLHAEPPPPEKTWWEKGRIYGFEYDVLRFDSGYEPPADLPGAGKWKGFRGNRTCSVRVLRHPGPPRPWLICIHGYRMGVPWLDFSLFSPTWLYEQLGLNVLMPVLPLHGPRREGLRSGDSFLDGHMSDLVFAEAQSLWDLRRTLAWLRREEPEARAGLFGFSLGGYNAALMTGYESKLDFAVAAIPAVDFAELLWRHLPKGHQQYYAARGITEERHRSMLRVVSPLTQPPLLPQNRLLIFAGTGDRLVMPSQALLLSRHWGVPVNWFQGAHLTVRRERATRETLREAMLRASWPTG
jgi:hypothetical protein